MAAWASHTAVSMRGRWLSSSPPKVAAFCSPLWTLCKAPSGQSHVLGSTVGAVKCIVGMEMSSSVDICAYVLQQPAINCGQILPGTPCKAPSGRVYV
eukprot:285846-Pelagomonas_calceolata.AAC.1